MSEIELNRRFVDEQTSETAEQQIARRFALEAGLHAISPAAGAHLGFVAAAINADQIIEIGTDGGVSAAWLHRGAPNSTITCLDTETEYLADARQALVASGHSPARIRCIGGDPLHLLPRMSDDHYDLVVVQDDLANVAANLRHALRIVRPGGTIIVLGVLNHGRVADPTRRDPVTNSLRAIIREFQRQPDVAASLLPIGDGILQLTTRSQ